MDLIAVQQKALQWTLIGFYECWVLRKVKAITKVLVFRLTAAAVLQAMTLTCAIWLVPAEYRIWLVGVSWALFAVSLVLICRLFHSAMCALQKHSSMGWYKEIQENLRAEDKDYVSLCIVPTLSGQNDFPLRPIVREAMQRPALASLSFIRELHALAEGRL